MSRRNKVIKREWVDEDFPADIEEEEEEFARGRKENCPPCRTEKVVYVVPSHRPSSSRRRPAERISRRRLEQELARREVEQEEQEEREEDRLRERDIEKQYLAQKAAKIHRGRIRKQKEGEGGGGGTSLVVFILYVIGFAFIIGLLAWVFVMVRRSRKMCRENRTNSSRCNNK